MDLDEPRNVFREAVRRAQAGLAALVEVEPVTEEPSVSLTSNITEWPSLDSAAFYGLAGRVADLYEPHTEADPVALVVSFLAEIGTMVGRGPHLNLDGSYHPLLFWPVLVGQSSKARKGTAGKRISAFLGLADPERTRGEAKGTLCSGEGLAFAVRDPQFKEEPVKERGHHTGETITIQVDAGVAAEQPGTGRIRCSSRRRGSSRCWCWRCSSGSSHRWRL